MDAKYIPGKPDRCPSCGRSDIRPSVVGGLMDFLRRQMSQSPYRCRACEHRFYRRMKRVEAEVEAATESSSGEQ